MPSKEYCAIVSDTRKADKYIQRKGYAYFGEFVACGDFYVKHTVVACDDEKSREHIRKQYPNASISFASREGVQAEHDMRRAAWLNEKYNIA